MRLEHPTEKTAKVIRREDYDKDCKFGYVILEFNPERTEIVKDRRSEREITRTLQADIVYRCVDCQFDSLDKDKIEEHRADGNHLWAYSPFENPYGHIADVEIEGIENYQDFLNSKRR